MVSTRAIPRKNHILNGDAVTVGIESAAAELATQSIQPATAKHRAG
jgi:hypothetical protein